MRQQINLHNPAFRRQRDRLDARAAGGSLAAAALLCALGGAWLSWVAEPADAAERQAQEQASRDEQNHLADLKQQLATRRHAVEAELRRVQGIEQAIARVQGALTGGSLGEAPVAYSAYFEALANQRHAALWITGFSVSADGRALELRGQALDAAALPDYLGRLNEEPVFRGRRFAQMTLGSVLPEGAAEGSAPVTEFVLRGGGSADFAKEAAK